MGRPLRVRPVRSALLRVESLETRRLLAAAARQIAWLGETVTARADGWIVTTDGAAPQIGDGWSARPLGLAMFAVTAPGASPAAVASWATATNVRGVEPDRIITSKVLPNDPSLGSLWGLDNSGQTGGVADADIDAAEAWSVTTGSRSVVVGVVDTGIDYRHPDLAANMWRNPGEVAGDRIDNDGNGYVDDVFGWDFANNDADPFDDEGHGTHVAGTIGAVGNNGTGVTGVSWQVSLMALKFLGADGSGTTSAAIAALNYATLMRQRGVNVVATNNSWGGGGGSTALTNAVVAGGNAGIVCVAAAGNEASNNDAVPSFPANVDSSAVISVAATDSSNRLASFSNFGVTTVDVGAPGVGILSTTPAGGYASYSGTSMAAPHVSGIVALLAAANPRATSSQIRTAILSSAVPVPSLAGRVATGGLANAAAALAAVGGGTAPPPSQPAPTADVIDVAPDPRTTSVSGIVVQFSRAVTGVDAADIGLTRNGGTVPLAGVTATSTDGIRWTIGGLAAATATAGTYVLTVNASGSGIRAVDDGGAFVAAVSDTWVTQAPTLADAGETLSTAASLGITSGELRLSGRIGDGSFGSRDVDLYRVTLAAGQTLTIDVDAQTLAGGSSLDSFVRVFNSSGRQLASNDDDGTTLDSRLVFRAPSRGTFFVGISGYGNAGYSPTRAGSGAAGSTGVYQAQFTIGPSTATTATVRVAGFRDAGRAVVPAGDAAFAAYGANWMAAVPSSTPGLRPRRLPGC